MCKNAVLYQLHLLYWGEQGSGLRGPQVAAIGSAGQGKGQGNGVSASRALRTTSTRVHRAAGSRRFSRLALCGTLGTVVYPRRGAWQAGGGAAGSADYNSRQAVRRGGAGRQLPRPVAGDSRDLGVAAGPWTAAATGVRASSASSRRRQVPRRVATSRPPWGVTRPALPAC